MIPDGHINSLDIEGNLAMIGDNLDIEAGSGYDSLAMIESGYDGIMYYQGTIKVGYITEIEFAWHSIYISSEYDGLDMIESSGYDGPDMIESSGYDGLDMTE